jgi:hypothetical protein
MTEDTPTDETAAGDTREDETAAGDTREDETAPKTLGELSHTDPFTNEAFGATQTYDRGRTIAADGGSDPEREADADATADGEPATDGGEAEPEELKDVAHTPPGDTEGTNAVYERGHEGREENR